MYIMPRPPSAWNLFVKKIFHEGKAKDSGYQFKQALKDASRRKSEMGNGSATKHHNKHRHSGGAKKTHRRKTYRRKSRKH